MADDVDIATAINERAMENAVARHRGELLPGENAAIAKKYGVRLIAYEGGQHLINYTDADLLRAANRSALMGQIYTDYLAGWYAKTGDLHVLFYSAGPTTVFGAWGLREYSGQPRGEAPKIDATLKAMGN